jgi:spore coat polysaccharide biosynthesis protein SpsF (cytidylyltransferase family)
MKVAIFITIRSDSSRLPNKAFLPLLGKPTIMMVILRAKLVRNADEIIVCTTERSIDDTVVEWSKECGVKHYRGSLEDKLDRWLGATKQFGVDGFVTMDGDDPLCDPELMESGIEQLKSSNNDFVEAPKGLVCGGFTYGIRTTALQKVCALKDTNDTEMMWVYFKETGLFNVATLNIDDPIFFDSNIRLTLDYIEDYIFFKKVFEHFKCVYNELPLRQIMSYLKNNPNVVKINSFRQEDWSSNQTKKTKLVLKKL